MTSKEQKIKDLMDSLDICRRSINWANKEIPELEMKLKEYRGLERRLGSLREIECSSRVLEEKILEDLLLLK